MQRISSADSNNNSASAGSTLVLVPSTILVFFFRLFDLSTALHISSIGNPFGKHSSESNIQNPQASFLHSNHPHKYVCA